MTTATTTATPTLSTPIHYDLLDTPIGALLLCADAHGLTQVQLPRETRAFAPPPHWRRDAARLAETRAQFADYFAGRSRTFTLARAARGTPFQHAVWDALCEIPYGTTISYAELARRIGRPSAVRAVGAANGANPLAILVPCHRVIGADGTLTGYAGGLPMKQWLLAHERRHLPQPAFALTPQGIA